MEYPCITPDGAGTESKGWEASHHSSCVTGPLWRQHLAPARERASALDLNVPSPARARRSDSLSSMCQKARWGRACNHRPAAAVPSSQDTVGCGALTDLRWAQPHWLESSDYSHYFLKYNLLPGKGWAFSWKFVYPPQVKKDMKFWIIKGAFCF